MAKEREINDEIERKDMYTGEEEQERFVDRRERDPEVDNSDSDE